MQPNQLTPAQVRQRIAQILAVLDHLDHYQVLGVAPSSTKNVIEASYRALATTFHPDRIAALGLADLHEAAGRIFARISEAHMVLADDRVRAEYDHRLRVQRIARAEAAFREGSLALQRGHFAVAETHFKIAFECRPEEGEYLAMLIWAMFINPEHDRSRIGSEVLAKMLQAARLAPNNARIQYYLGRVRQERGEIAEAIAAYREALSHDPTHHDAALALRVLEKRNPKAAGKSWLPSWLQWRK